MKNKPYLPSKLPLENTPWDKIITLIGKANGEIARYDGILQSVPNPTMLLSPLTTQEAVLSSKIEGTQATLEDVLKYEANPKQKVEKHNDIQEVLNYRKAMFLAISEMERKPMTLKLIKKIHSVLLDSVRGQNKGRGQFRTVQNWIGKPGSPMEEARYVPPEPMFLAEYLDNFEKYIHYTEKDRLVQLAIVHAQFEIIHPFLDGNGRIGRILVPLYLYEKKILSNPMFYVSAYLENHRQQYYDTLLSITKSGNWVGWIIFFMTALIEQSKANSIKARQILRMYDLMKTKIVDITHSQYSILALDYLFKAPIVSTSDFIEQTRIPRQSALRILKKLNGAEILGIFEIGRGNKPTIYIFNDLLNIITK